MSEWISVDERLPEEGILVIVCDKNAKDAASFISFYFHERKVWSFCGMTFHPTHWMPLPEPPKE